MTADEAARAVRAADRTGSLGMISAEANPPYDRPPLTKGLWKGMPEEKVWRGTDTLGVDLHLGRQAQVLDATRKRVADDQGDVYTYEKLLLATGGRPRHLPFDHDPSDVVYYRTLRDYRRLVQMTERKQRFAVVGGGFIGSEIAAALAMNGQDVVMIFPEQGVGGLFFPTGLAQFLNQYYRDRGVEVRNGRLVEGLAKQDGQTVLKLDDQSTVAVDGVIAGLGIQPNTELAEFAGLKIDDGIVVDQFLRTSEADIFAAGDVALFPDPLLGVRRRVEHEDNAIHMGQVAGRAMAGDPVPYDHSPYFYSDLFDLGYEAVGELNSKLETVSDWQEEYEKGVVYYLQDGRVRGVLLWHVWDQIDAARELMAEPAPVAAADLMGRLPAS